MHKQPHHELLGGMSHVFERLCIMFVVSIAELTDVMQKMPDARIQRSDSNHATVDIATSAKLDVSMESPSSDAQINRIPVKSRRTIGHRGVSRNCDCRHCVL